MGRRYHGLADLTRGPGMILVDTSVWAAWFNGVECTHMDALGTVLAGATEPVVMLPVILTEVLQGFRSETGFRDAERQLRRLPQLQLSTDTFVEAARLFRRLRRRGITVRGAVDCIIAAACIETGCRLLTLDADFGRIAACEPLELVIGAKDR